MFIRQSAFEGNSKLLKGALHCHTTRSDGVGTPEDVMRLHAEHGYNFMALTDHRNYNFKNFAPETGITVIPGMEFDDTIYWGDGFRCFHTVCLGRSNTPYEQDQKFESGTAKTQEDYQPYLDKLHAEHQLTIHCHPEWSGTPAKYFDKLEGNFAMEIWNSGCAIEDGMDTNAAYWDELLGDGKRIWGVATDDGHAMSHHCNGWVMVNSANEPDAILDALEAGSFYSSCGPVIKDFYVEDGKAYIETETPVKRVYFQSMRHPSHQVKGENGELITSASTDISGDWTGPWKYVRVTVEDAEGRRAWTNPIFVK